MRRTSSIFLATLLAVASGQSARADFIYRFTTTTSAGIGGSLSVTIDAPDSAVSTGTISSGDISSLSMQLSGTSAPFVDGMTTSTSALVGSFSVDTTTGAFTAMSPELFAAFPPETVTLAASSSSLAGYTVSIPDVVQDGQGVWSVTQSSVAEPSTGVMAFLAGLIGLAVALRHRGRRGRDRARV
jgi:hypothetical protein